MARKNKLNNRGQITIFIILALIIVVSIIIIFFLIKKPQFQTRDIENPQAYIDSCVSEFTEEAINILSEQGGDIAPEGSTMFRGKNITYLCYNANYYSPCIMQRPDLIMHIEDEITGYIEPKVENCFNSLKTKLEKEKYAVEIGESSIFVSLGPKQAVVEIKREFRATKNEKDMLFNSFKITLNTPIYDLTKIAMEIANQEADYCNFDIVKFMTIYPEYDLDKFRTGNPDTIYTLKEIISGEDFRFAIRSCAMPPGF